MAKLLIIDKCHFQGTSLPRLADFVRDYQVVLPYTLCIECLMSEDKNGREPSKDPITLLCRLDTTVKAGACVGHASSALFRNEKKSLALVSSVVDEGATLQVGDNVASFERGIVSPEAEICRKTFDPLIGLLLELGQTYFDNVVKKDLREEFRGDFQPPMWNGQGNGCKLRTQAKRAPVSTSSQGCPLS